MTSDIICLHQGEDGTVCGEAAREHERHADPEGCIHHAWPDNCCDNNWHPFVPGRKCPTCDGEKWVAGECSEEHHQNRYGFRCAMTHKAECPTCADSPVRGYVPA